MKRYILLVLLMVIWVPGCPGPSDPCENVNCAHGTCHDGECQCETDWYGDLCDHHDQCRNLELDASMFLASMVLEAGETGTTTVEDAPLIGSYIAVNDPDTLTERANFVMGIAFGVNVPIGFYPLDVSGPEILALNADQPFRQDDNGSCVFNEVELHRKIEIYINRYGIALFHDGADWVYPSIESGFTYQITENGVLISTMHTSPYYILNTVPLLAASCVAQEDRTLVCDLTGSEDDGFSLPFLFPTVFLKDGDLEVVLTHDGNFSYHSEPLSPGVYNFTVKTYGLNYDPVEHPEDKAEKALASITISAPDPCADVICEDDGDPCNGTEECVNGGCEHLNPVVCPDDGNPCNGDETCNPNSGLCEHENPVVCPDDGNVCNGNEACDQADGQCKSFSPLDCNDGLACNGEETCDPFDGCQPGITVNCNGHGSCAEPEGVCECADGWRGELCEIPPPVPTITDLAIDCSVHSDYCITGQTYPVNWNFTNATSFETRLTHINGPGGQNMGTLSPASGSLPENSQTISYTLGGPSPATIRITVTVYGLGGETSADLDINY